MAKQYVSLNYQFIFQGGSPWTHLSQFEADLADFFSANEVQAEVIKGVNGQQGTRIMLLSSLSIISRNPVEEKKQAAILEDHKKQQEANTHTMTKGGTFSSREVKDKQI